MRYEVLYILTAGERGLPICIRRALNDLKHRVL
jgi:hypothetical protein